MPDDLETEALAKELGVETAEPPKPDATPETPPKGEEAPKPPDKTEGAKPPEEEKKGDGEKADGETPPDPLDDLAKDPKFLQRILAHKELGPTFNRWADDGAKAQVRAAVEGAKGPTEAQIKEQLQIEKEDDFFSKLTPEQLKEELAHPEDGAKAAAAYGRFQLRQQEKAKGPTPEETNFNIQVAATKSLVVTYRQMVDGSDLSDEVKAELQPEKFTHLGANALPAWGEAIYKALVKQGVDQAKESAIEEAKAELDPERKGSGGGRPPGSMPDLMTTDSSVGLEAGLAAEEAARQRAKK